MLGFSIGALTITNTILGLPYYEELSYNGPQNPIYCNYEGPYLTAMSDQFSEVQRPSDAFTGSISIPSRAFPPPDRFPPTPLSGQPTKDSSKLEGYLSAVAAGNLKPVWSILAKPFQPVKTLNPQTLNPKPSTQSPKP